VGAAHDDLRTVDRAAHLEDEHLAVLADEVALVRGLLAARQDRLRLAELEDRGARLEALDLPVDDVALAVGILRVHLLALGLAQRLLNDLLRGLRSDPAEGRRGLLERDRVPERHVRLHPARCVDLDVQLGVLDLVDDGLEEEDLERTGLDVDLHVDVLFGAVRALDRSGDDVAHDLFGEALFGGELRETGDEFSVHGMLPLFILLGRFRRQKRWVAPPSRLERQAGTPRSQERVYQIIPRPIHGMAGLARPSRRARMNLGALTTVGPG
jgi:hypothetical protein